MCWKIIKEKKRQFRDKSYYLKAEYISSPCNYTLEISWAQFIYILLVKDAQGDLIYSALIGYEDRIEKYGHQIMRMSNKNPQKVLTRLDNMQYDAALNFNIMEKYNVEIKSTLPIQSSN